MPGRQPRLHLPYGQWPAPTGCSGSAPWAAMTPLRRSRCSLGQGLAARYLFAWRRFLGFLAIHEPTALELAPSERLTIDRIRAFRAHLAETNVPRSVAGTVGALYKAARLMMPERDWTWLKAVKTRLYRAAPSLLVQAGRVITSLQLLDLGEELMEESKPKPGSSDQQERCHPVIATA